MAEQLKSEAISSDPKGHKRIIVTIKKKQLRDEYILTDKHLVYKFKYLILCFDTPNDMNSDPTQSESETCHGNTTTSTTTSVETSTSTNTTTEDQGLVVLTAERLKEALGDLNLVLDSTQIGEVNLHAIVETLKEWHPLISKVEIDHENLSTITNLSEYPIRWKDYQPVLLSLPNNSCVRTPEDFLLFTQQPHVVLEVKVFFQLVKKIKAIDELDINPYYLQKLLTQSFIKWNNEKHIFLDEISVTQSCLPFAKKGPTKDGVCYVYPHISLIPLYPIDPT